MTNKTSTLRIGLPEICKDELTGQFEVRENILVHSMKMVDQAVIDEVIETAKRNGATWIVLLDEDWVMSALKEKARKDESIAERHSLLSSALETYGAESQTRMVFEEFAELQKELCKSLRGFDNADDIAEEIADVQIMLEQMMILYDCEDAVTAWKEAKLNRLARNIGMGDKI